MSTILSSASRNRRRVLNTNEPNSSNDNYPFRIIQAIPSASVASTNWRNVRVYGPGLVNNFPVSNLSNAVTPLDILVPVSTNNFYIYIKVVISSLYTIDSAIVGGAIEADLAGSVGWTWYPDIAITTAGNSTKRFILIGYCNTTDDTTANITIYNYVRSSIFIPMPGFEPSGNCWIVV